MSQFDSTKRSLDDVLKDISNGKIQLPDFQRGWVWDDNHVRSLLVSIARSFPVGAVMLLETGGEGTPFAIQLRVQNQANKELQSLICHSLPLR